MREELYKELDTLAKRLVFQTSGRIINDTTDADYQIALTYLHKAATLNNNGDLIEDYEQRLKTAHEVLQKKDYYSTEQAERIKSKAECYRTIISELKRKDYKNA